MKQKSMSILFYLNKSKTNKKGTCPIKCRITYLKIRKEFATGLFTNPKFWNSKKQVVENQAKNSEILNGQIEIISTSIKKSYMLLQLEVEDFSAEDIFKRYLGKPTKRETRVIGYFKEFLRKQRKLVGKDIQMATWKKFDYACSQTKEFIVSKYGKQDLPIKELKQQFLNDFEYFLKTEKNQKQVTINKTIQRFRKPIKEAIAEGFLAKDPFTLHKPGKVRKELVFLSVDELYILENHQFHQTRLQLVKDLFIFCCYTGLAYNEMSNLKKEHILKGFDGNHWIRMTRQKTGKVISIPLLPKARAILGKYENNGDYALPRFSNQKINSYLKEIGAIVGINKSITHHMARKTFASTVLLYNDVPMEIVSELLGHSSIKITQEYYGKVVQKRVSIEMARISTKLS